MGKWLSLPIALAVALLNATAVWLVLPPSAAGAHAWLPAVLAGALTGVVAVGIWLVAAAQHHRQAHTLVAYLRSAEKSGTAIAHHRFKSEWAAVIDAISERQQQLQRRLDQTAGSRRELEIQLHVAESQHKHAMAILNCMADGVLATDAFNELTLANEAAARVLGFDLAPAMHRPLEQVLNDQSLVKLIKETHTGGETALRRHTEHRLCHNGHTAIYDLTLTCVSETPTKHNKLAGGSKPAGVVAILRDITREKEVAEMKSSFVSAVSHELRTPLSSIKAYVEMLADGEAKDETTRAEFYGIIQSEANRLQRLIDNILNISRIESGVVKVQREHISLPAIVREVLEVMQPQARARNIELTEVETPVFFQVFADKDMVYQALLNLVSNAIKYTPGGGKVTISITVDEHARMVNISVTDTGVGIPADALPHLFGKFFRVSEHKKMAKGTGLGLNLVKQIVENVHGGKVWVQSAPQKGSTFTFGLPLAENT